MDKITIFGVGSSGIRTVNYLLDKLNSNKFDFVCIDSDRNLIELSKVRSLQIGRCVCKNLNCGGVVANGINAAEENFNEIKNSLKMKDKLVIIAGFEDEYDICATQVIAKCAAEMEIRTTCILTVPFVFEGRRRRKTALEGIEEIKHYFNSILVLHNDDILKNNSDKNVTLSQAFKMVNEKIYNILLALF